MDSIQMHQLSFLNTVYKVYNWHVAYCCGISLHSFSLRTKCFIAIGLLIKLCYIDFYFVDCILLSSIRSEMSDSDTDLFREYSTTLFHILNRFKCFLVFFVLSLHIFLSFCHVAWDSVPSQIKIYRTNNLTTVINTIQMRIMKENKKSKRSSKILRKKNIVSWT